MQDQKLAILGGGNMGGALLRGILEKKVLQPKNVIVIDVDTALLDSIKTEHGVAVSTDAKKAIADVDAVMLAVKPQVLPQLLGDIKSVLRPEQLVLSIVAGLKGTYIQHALGQNNPVVRIMPNIAATVQRSASAITVCEPATAEHLTFANDLLSAVGAVVEVAEAQMDAVTGLSGSGPAFVYTFIEALIDGGVRMGLTRPVARTLAIATVRGAAELVEVSGEHPGILRDRVTTPGGTTIAGLQALEEGAFRATVIHGVEAATERSAELGAIPKSR